MVANNTSMVSQSIAKKLCSTRASPVPLTLCHADGNMRKTKESDLMEIILKLLNQNSPPQTNKENTVYVIDLMAKFAHY